MFATKPLIGIAALVAASPVLAGSLDPVVVQPSVIAPAPVVTPAPVAQGSDWSGFYVGGQLGFGNLTVDGLPAALEDEYDGALYGVHAGYQRDFGRVVLGAEIDWDATDISVDPADDATALDVDSVARAKLRVGYDAGRVLPYATAGYARAMLSSEDDATDASLDDSYDGYFLGIGADFAVTERFSMGAEVLRHTFEDTPFDDIDVDVTTISIRGSFRF